MERQLLRRSQRLLLWLGFLPAVLSLTAYVISSRHVESVHASRTVSELTNSLAALVASARDAETGQRGYLLTGDPHYLEPYSRAVANLPEEVLQFEELCRKQGVPANEYRAFRRLLDDKMAELAETVALRRSRGLAAALEVVETGRGKRDMDKLRLLTHRFSEEQHLRFEALVNEEDRRQEILNITLSLGVLLSFYLLFFAYKFGTLYAQERDEVDAHIRHVVDERTAELSQRTGELEALSAELKRSNADLLQFAYIASHDLQEPLRTVASYVGLLARRYQGQLDANADKYIRFAIEGANRMQTLIADLLTYSRVGTQAAEASVVDLNSVLTVASANLGAAIAESGAVITAAPLPSVVADERRLTQVMQNLLANAMKFRKPDMPPVIHVSATKDGQVWTVSVADNGIGFESKYAERIFQVFQRLHSVGAYPGNGIGLAVCRRIIEQMGGHLSAVSQPGAGSTFYFSLPALSVADFGKTTVNGQSNAATS